MLLIVLLMEETTFSNFQVCVFFFFRFLLINYTDFAHEISHKAFIIMTQLLVWKSQNCNVWKKLGDEAVDWNKFKHVFTLIVMIFYQMFCQLHIWGFFPVLRRYTQYTIRNRFGNKLFFFNLQNYNAGITECSF